jgi:large repetitive protein
MSVQDNPDTRPEVNLTDGELGEDDVEAHGAKEFIAGLSTAVVLGSAGAGAAAAMTGSSSSVDLNPRQTVHNTVDTAFDTADAAQQAAGGAMSYAQHTADTAIRDAQGTAAYAANTATSTAYGAVDTAVGLADSTWDWASQLRKDVRDMALSIIRGDGDVDTRTRVATTMPRSFAGQAVTLTAAVTPAEARTAPLTGTVTFLDGIRSLGSAELGSGGLATLTVDLGAGEHALTAVYSGDETFKGSASAQMGQDVVKAVTSTVVRSSIARSVTGKAVKFTATITSAHPNVQKPTGTVSFWAEGMQLGTGRVAPDGTATISTDKLDAGTHDVIARYAGDALHAASESLPVPQVVVEDPATTASSTSSAAAAQANSLIARAASQVPGSVDLVLTVGSTSARAGVKDGATITFKDGDRVLGTATVKNGQATLTVAAAGISGTVSASAPSGTLASVQM